MSVRYFRLDVLPRVIACIEVDHKPAAYKLFAGGAGLQFYVKGSTVKIVDKLANIVMNKAIEVNGTTRGVTLERRCPCQKKVSPKQLKLL